MSDAITSTKLEQTGGIFWDSRCCSECVGICVLSPGHENEMRGYLVLSADCKILISLILFKFSYITLDSLIVDFGVGWF